MDNDNQSPYDQPLDLPGGDSQQASVQQFKPPKRKRNFKLPLIILVVLIVLAGLGYGSWKLLSKKKAPPATQNTAATTPTTPQNQEDVPAVTATKDFTAQTLAVEFNYPSSWIVTENNGGITAISPTFSYMTQDRDKINGYFKIYIRNTARDVDGKYIGRGVVIQPTQQLTYTQPAPGQRTSTNLSFFGYDTPDNFAFMMITGNFNLKKGDTLGVNYGKEAGTYIIVGGFSSTDQKDDLGFNKVSPDNFQSSNAYQQAVEILKSLKVS